MNHPNDLETETMINNDENQSQISTDSYLDFTQEQLKHLKVPLPEDESGDEVMDDAPWTKVQQAKKRTLTPASDEDQSTRRNGKQWSGKGHSKRN